MLTPDPAGIQPNYTQPFQFCGGYLDPITFNPQPYITASGVPSTEGPKGYWCPVQSVCMVCHGFSTSIDNVGKHQSLQQHGEFR